MAQNQTLFDILKGCCSNVYFQPPETVRLEYPCIIFRLSKMENDRADNMPYTHWHKYTAIVIDRNPFSQIATRMIDEIRYCSSDRVYTADNLYHHVLTIYHKDGPWLWSPFDLQNGYIRP